MEVLCLDCEKEFEVALRKKHHQIHSGQLGYRNGARWLGTPPHEVDAIIFNLEKPACFDMRSWGPDGGNDNFKCAIVESPSDGVLHYQSPMTIGERVVPRYQLIFDSQIRTARVGTQLSFGVQDILRAIRDAGTPLFVFLNHSYMKHVTVGSPRKGPNIFGTGIYFEPTTARKVTVHSLIQKHLPVIGASSFNLTYPVKYKFGQRVELPEGDSLLVCNAVANAVGDVFSKLMFIDNGFVWYLPEFENNLEILDYLLGNIGEIRQLGVGLRASRLVVDTPIPVPELVKMAGDKVGLQSTPLAIGRTGITQPEKTDQAWDAFICYATEDKNVAETIANELKKQGKKVWYDQFVLKVGDSLRRAIDQGLVRSRYGIVVLSHAFFRKDWPQKELDGLSTKERSDRKVILPVWHEISRDEIEQYSPLLAGLYAAKTEDGMPRVVKDLISAMQ